jgi:thiol-disulfide isomerase/thioredoxin
MSFTAPFWSGGGKREMRSSPLILCLLSLVSVVVGCSQTGALRSSNTSDVRTIASVGDKPLPIVAGEPGAGSLRVETEPTDRPERKGSRISGRVFDDRGKPVPDVNVRLAVGGAAGGKAAVATTDRSGAFTLNGLRSNTSYTVIAEYEDEDGTMSGRAQVKAPQADVRIALKPRGGANQGHASIRPARPRVEPISNIDSADEEPLDETREGSGRRLNAEDLEPPAAEAAALFPDDSLRTRRGASDRSQNSARSGWNASRGGPEVSSGADPDRHARDEGTETGARGDSADRPASEGDDDGPNPLPPAIESRATSNMTRPRVLVEENLVRTAQRDPSRASRTGSQAEHAELEKRDSTAGDFEQQPGPVPRPIPAGLLATDATRTGVSANSQRRPTWRELADKQTDVPLDESLARGATQAPRADKGVVTLTSTNQPAKSRLSRFLGGAHPKLDEAVKQSACSIDPNERRLIDFRLPDLSGKVVSLHEIDADVILLDFWGSWCQPCRKSIPHLVDLQSKLAGKRVQVIGIACEKEANAADRQASAAKAVEQLGINYPVLLSSRDGSCPLQEALQVQFYPTMVLLSRDGRLLAREHGATDVTLPRMDRAIAMALQEHATPARN